MIGDDSDADRCDDDGNGDDDAGKWREVVEMNKEDTSEKRGCNCNETRSQIDKDNTNAHAQCELTPLALVWIHTSLRGKWALS